MRFLAGHHDFSAAFRSLRRAPGFVAVALLSLGVAIGVNGTTFALLDAVTHPYVPYAHPDQLLTVRTYGWATGHVDLSPDMLHALAARRDLFADVVPWMANGRNQAYLLGQTSMPGNIVLVAPGFVHALDVALAAGRGFAPYVPGESSSSPALIGYSIWRQQYASSRDFSHMSISVAGESHPVVGVMPPGADYPGGANIWLRMPPAMARSLEGPGQIRLLVRLQPGQQPAKVQAALSAYALGVAHDHDLPSNMTAIMTADVTPRVNGVFGYSAGIAIASFLMLLAACLNVANVMLARGVARRREIAVRVAIGASGGAIVRYIMAEAVVLALGGGALGTLLAVWGIEAVQSYMPAAMLQFWFRIPAFNWRVLIFILFATAVTALLSGLVPALRAQRADVSEAMKDGGYAVSGRAHGAYRIVVSAQLVLSLMMAMAASALLEELHPPPQQVSPINERNLYSGSVVPSQAACRAMPHRDRFVADMMTAIASVPGVKRAAVAMGARPIRAEVTSDQPSEPVQLPMPSYILATPAFFRARGIAIVAGRDFEAGDVAAGAAIVNLAVAKQLWPLMSPVGRAIKLGSVGSDAPWVRVIGVASAPVELADGEHFDLAPRLTVVGRSGCAGASYWARVEHDDRQTVGALYHNLRSAFPGAVVSDIYGTSAGAMRVSYTAKVTAYTYTGVALFMLLLSAAGVYGVMSLVVGQRSREFAVRIALGAEGRDLWRLVLRDALVMGLAGVGIGAFFAMRFSPYGGLSLHVVDADPIALVLGEAAVVGATLLACVLPARRASRTDPVDVLRAT